ncbi:MAG TPA: hypothetical protein DDY49_11940 [Paenibacillaceae bacterium]|nr:hypothetical protein [Paenibacillaceae bacterium]
MVISTFFKVREVLLSKRLHLKGMILMPNLGDYIGYLMTEITNARAQADYEAVNIAERYARDPYLKHFPIPHFRMPNVSVDLPLIINNVEEPTGKYSNDQMLSYMQAKFRKVLPRHLDKLSTTKKRSLTLDGNIKKITDNIFEEYKQLDHTPIRITHLADKLVSSIRSELSQLTPLEQKDNKEKIEQVSQELKQQLYSEFSKYLHDQPRLNVTANTSDIKNAGPKDILAYVRITITEEAFEWTAVEEDNQKTRRLIPE